MWFFLLVLAAYSAVNGSEDVVQIFTNPVNSPTSLFNHMVIDHNTGRVNIGAVNRIYQLSPDLELIDEVITGPVNDSAQCAYNCSSKAPTDNVNKVLVIDYSSNRLIACGSVLQGSCSVRNVNNISSDVREVQEPIVADDATSSTVAFIAPGPPNPPTTQVVYVGVTFTGNSPNRSDVPAVSSRSLEDDRLFMIARTANTTGTRMFVSSLSRASYPIKYVYGFSSEGFSYFLTTQLGGIDSDTYYSKLVRVCHDDENYYSYTEIPISCGSFFGYNLAQAGFRGKPGSVLARKLGITVQDDVLFVAFGHSQSINSDKPSDDMSALCVYSLKSIRQKFLDNIKTCFSGNGTRGLDFITPSQECIPTKSQSISEDFCGLGVNTPLGGEQPVEAVPAVVFTKRLTAVAAMTAGDYTVVFAGTAEGHLKKIRVESASSAFEYKDIVIDEGSPVNKDLILDTQSKYLYVLTERKLSKIKLQECNVYKSCSTCIEAKDPYCGWCPSENKCSLRSECRAALENSLNWVSYRSARCPIIALLVPHQVQKSTAKMLDIVIQDMPHINEQLFCEFKVLNHTLVTDARLQSYGVKCATPPPDTLPSIPSGQHQITSRLSVRTEKGPSLVGTKFKFYDCNTFNSCTQCVSSKFECDWCIDGHRCTHNYSENCGVDILVTGVSRYTPSYRKGPEFCPAIDNSTFNGTNEILVPFGAKKRLKVKVHIIGQFVVQTRFVCQFNIEGKVAHVYAQLLADTVYCDEFEFTYTSRAPNVTASFDVIWGGSKALDNLGNIHVLIYRCDEMADNYSACSALPKKFGCAWCQGSDKCEVLSNCATPPSDTLPSIPSGQHYITSNMSVHSEQGPSLAATNTEFYDCGSFNSCTQCVSSKFPCDWCIAGHRCTHNTSESCRNDILVTSVNRDTPSYRKGPEFCPTIDNSTLNGTNEILVPFGAKKRLKVKVHIVGQFIVQTRFVCQFNIEGKVDQVNAQLLADTVYCDEFEFTYTSRAPNVTASFDVIWGGSKVLDNLGNIHVLIYRCDEMADNYSACSALPKKFGCAWCQESDKCEVLSSCATPPSDTLPLIPSVQHHIASNLSVHTEQGPGLVGTKIEIKDCDSFNSCTQCVSSRFSCDWCIEAHRCTHNTSESCRNDILVTNVNRYSPSYRKGPEFCPTINNSTLNGTNEILVPFGAKKRLKVKVHIIGQFIVQTRFVCQFNIEGKVAQVNAQLLADTVYCDEFEFTYTSRAPNVTASFDVIWGGSKALDNLGNLHVLIYRCDEMADNYSACSALPKNFGCAWCQGSYKCEVLSNCATPLSDTLPSIPSGQHYITSNMSVHSEQGPSLAATNTEFYDCGSFNSCTQCVSSKFPCDWCIAGHRCTHNTSESCRNDILVTSVNRDTPSYRKGPEFCPTIDNSTLNGTNEILVPFGAKKRLKVKVHIVGQFIVQTRFVCQFNIEGKVDQVNAQLLADTVYCDEFEFTYTSRAPNVTASFDVIWGGSKALDNLGNIHVLIYRCDEMADDSSTCSALPKKFECAWCQRSDKCEILSNCATPPSDTLPLIPSGQQHIASNLSVHTEQEPNLVGTKFEFNDCGSFNSCTQCVSSRFSCDWCVEAHRCTHNTSKSCRNDILVTSVNRDTPSYRKGPEFCPSIDNSNVNGTNEILVPFGAKKRLKVKVHIIGQFIVQTRFVCQFNIEGKVAQVNAQLLADTVYCDEFEFTYTSRAPNVTASFDVIWGGSKVLDNLGNIHVLIYRCDEMADNCSLCSALPKKFGCAWCEGSDKCEVLSNCNNALNTYSVLCLK